MATDAPPPPPGPPDGSSPPAEDAGVIPLSRFRAGLARARKGRRIDALLAAPNPTQLVPALPTQEVFYAIKEVGLADAHDLVALSSPAQIRGYLDLDAWTRDQLDEKKMQEWLDAVLEGAGPVKLKRVVEGLDPEAVALYVRRSARVYDLTLEDDIPEEPEGHLWSTPDNNFVVEVLPEGERGKAFERFLDSLYRVDLQLARWLLMSARSEMTSELEELSYRFRSGRMADLGYVDYYDALSAYAAIDPASLTLDAGPPPPPPAPIEPDAATTLPLQLVTGLDTHSLFARALATIGAEAELEKLLAALMLLVNKTMSADLVEPGELDAVQGALERAVGLLDVGLESLAARTRAPDEPPVAGDALVQRAAQALRSVSLEKLFRLGFTTVTRLQALARTLLARGLVVVPPLAEPLADAPWDDLLVGLAQQRPQFARALDRATAPPGGPRTPAQRLRPFRSLADVARAAQALEELAQIGPLVLGGLGLAGTPFARAVRRHLRATPAGFPPAPVRYGTLVRTLAAGTLVGRPADAPLDGLSPRERRALAERLGPGPLAPAQRRAVEEALVARLAAHGARPSPLWERLIENWLGGDFGRRLEEPGFVLARPSWLKLR